MNLEQLNYRIVDLLMTNSIADILELLSEHTGIQSERLDDRNNKEAYLAAMGKIHEATRLLRSVE
jgi:hypothetical protein